MSTAYLYGVSANLITNSHYSVGTWQRPIPLAKSNISPALCVVLLLHHCNQAGQIARRCNTNLEHQQQNRPGAGDAENDGCVSLIIICSSDDSDRLFRCQVPSHNVCSLSLSRVLPLLGCRIGSSSEQANAHVQTL